MIRLKNIISLFSVFIVSVLILWAQDAHSQIPKIDSLLKKFDTYRTHALQEKIYLHLDQNFYLIGETAWFKIYCVDGSFHKPLDLSKVAYIELLDKTNIPVLQTKVGLKNGHGNGSFFLPATLQSGNYKIRCYTQWMKNFSAEFFFEKTITITNPFVIPEREKIKNSDIITAAFFPEGGYLVTGIESKIGFKISNASGEGINVKGAIVNNDNDTITMFSPLKFGLGSFYFTPLANQQYRAVVKNKNGGISIFPFPEARQEGYVMSLSDSAGKITITVAGKIDDPEKAKFVYLFVHSRNIITRAEVKYFHTRERTFDIDTKDLPEGISHFTVLDENENPVCERLYFRQPEKKLQLKINTAQQQYGQRRKVNLTLQSKAGESNLSGASISLAVYKSDSLSTPDRQNIFEYLWLSSDIPGKIESPEYYFINKNDTARKAIDNLMLTHGWRRFKWKDVLSSETTFSNLPEYRGHIIKASVTSTDTNTGGILTYLSIPGKNTRFYPARSNRQGEALFEVPSLHAQNTLILQASPAQSGLSKMEIQNPFSVNFSSKPLPPFQLPAENEKNFLSRTIAMQVQDIYHDENLLINSQHARDSLPFYGHADETYYLDRYTRFPVMEEVMREYVPGVFVRKRKDGFYFIVIDDVNKGVFANDPMILLDGIPLFDADKIMEVDPRKVKKLEVVKRRYYLGPVIMDGIVSFTTYEGDYAGIELDPGSVSLNYDGLQLQREFYSPQYETQKQLSSRLPDRRYLLYWNPDIITKDDGTATVEFYTSDITGTFQVIAEGTTKDGFTGSADYTVIVK